jgi:thiamine biosynthesis lipoprotein
MSGMVFPFSVFLLVGFNSAPSHLARGTPHAARDTSLHRFEFEQPHMGTIARIVLYASDETHARMLSDRAFARIAALDARLTDYRDDSELMQLSAKAGGPAVTVSEDLARVLDAAQRVARMTDGAFDVTIGPLSRLWRRARAAGEPPDRGELAAAQRLVGYRHMDVSAERRTVRLAARGMMLDLGGIGKGFAADEALAVLRAAGARAAIVALGGDVAAGDPPPDASGWRVAIAPLGPSSSAQSSKLLCHAGISTSGDAEQFLVRGGVRLSHVLDPSTGSARTGRRGVTVMAPTATMSDALSTAVNVMGPERGLKVIDETPGASALFVELTAAGPKELRSRRW